MNDAPAFECDCPNDHVLLVSDDQWPAIINDWFCITAADIEKFIAFTVPNGTIMTTIDVDDTGVDLFSDVNHCSGVVKKGTLTNRKLFIIVGKYRSN